MFAGFPNQSPPLTMVWRTPEVCRARKRRNSCSRSSRQQLGSFSNGDGNENDKNAMGLLCKTTSHVHHAFLYISLPSLHFCENNLRASSPIWASEASLARTRERARNREGPARAVSRGSLRYPNRRACSQATVKMPDFTLYGGRKQATTNFSFSF